MPKGRADAHWITTALATERLGLTRPRLEQLHADKVLTARMTGSAREWLWPTIRDEYLEHRAAAIAKTMASAPSDPHALHPRDRLATAQAEKIEHELAVRRTEYVTNAFHLREVEILAGRVATILGTLGSTYRERSLGLTEATVDAFWRDVENAMRADMHDAVATTEDADPVPTDADAPSAPTTDAPSPRTARARPSRRRRLTLLAGDDTP